MKRFYATLLSGLFLFINYNVSGQLDTSGFALYNSIGDKNFAYVNDGNIWFGEKVRLSKPLLQSSYIIVDERRFKTSNVKFYRSHKGFFANVSSIEFTSDFAERTITGNINFYEIEAVLNASALGKSYAGLAPFTITISTEPDFISLISA